jgi:hypothetical protein
MTETAPFRTDDPYEVTPASSLALPTVLKCREQYNDERVIGKTDKQMKDYWFAEEKTVGKFRYGYLFCCNN